MYPTMADLIEEQLNESFSRLQDPIKLDHCESLDDSFSLLKGPGVVFPEVRDKRQDKATDHSSITGNAVFKSTRFQLRKLALEMKITKQEHQQIQLHHEISMKDEEAKLIKAEIRKLKKERETADKLHLRYTLEVKYHCEFLKNQFEEVKTSFSKDSSMYRYASALKEAATPEYVLVLRAKLCCQIHHFSVMSVHVRILDEKSMSQINAMKEDLQKQVDEHERLAAKTVQLFSSALEDDVHLLQKFQEEIEPQRTEIAEIDQDHNKSHQKEMRRLEQPGDTRKSELCPDGIESLDFSIKHRRRRVQHPGVVSFKTSMQSDHFNFRTSPHLSSNISNNRAQQVLDTKLTTYTAPLETLKNLDVKTPRIISKKKNNRAMAA